MLRSQIDYSRITNEEGFNNTKQKIKASAQMAEQDPYFNMSESQETQSSHTVMISTGPAAAAEPESGERRLKKITPH